MRTIKVTAPDPNLLGATKEHVIDVEDEHAERIVRLGDAVYADEPDAGGDLTPEFDNGGDLPSGPAAVTNTTGSAESVDAATAKPAKRTPKADAPAE
jgi:hypothetical protein